MPMTPCNLYSIGKTVNEIQTKLSNDMCALYQWCRINSLSINFVKTACMLVSGSHRWSHLNSCAPNVNVHGVEIPVCKSQKVLDIIMNEVLDWTEQNQRRC